MKGDVIRKWCVFSTTSNERISGDFDSRHEAQAFAASDQYCVVADVVYDFRLSKPPRKTIDWVRSGEWFIGTIDGMQVAAATVVDVNQLVKALTNIEVNIAQPKCVIAVARFEKKTYSSTCLTVPIAKEWCERVVNGDEA